MVMTLFPSFGRLNLTEDDKANPHKSAYENYTGIVFDTAKNEFNIVTGKFRDKKDMYQKMTKQDKYLRRAYESRIWDWIQKNAKTPVDGYLMLSTAVSKWINNNVLSKYYKKLLHDLPYINREGRKGDPQTMGTEASFESADDFDDDMLNEDFDYDRPAEILRQAEQDGKTSKHTIRVYPVIDGQPDFNQLLRIYPQDGKPEQAFLYNDLLNAEYPVSISGTEVSQDTKDKVDVNRIFNPLIYRDIRQETKKANGIYRPYKQLAFVIDDRKEPIIASKDSLNGTAGVLENNPDFMPKTANKSATATANDMNKRNKNEVYNLRKALEDETLSDDERRALELQLKRAEQKAANSSEVASRLARYDATALNFDKETREKLADIKTQKFMINADDTLSQAEKRARFDELDAEYEKIKTDAREELVKTNANELEDQLYAKLDAINASNMSKEEKDREIDSILGRLRYLKGLNASANKTRDNEKALEKGQRFNKPISPANPLHAGNWENEFIAAVGNKQNMRKALDREYKSAVAGGDNELAQTIKGMYQKDPATYTKAEQKAAEKAVAKWNAENEKVKDFIIKANTRPNNEVPEELKIINNEIANKYGIKTYDNVNPDKKKITPDDLDSNIDNINIDDVNMNDIIFKVYKDLGNDTKIKPEERTNYFLNNQEEYKNRLNDIAKKLSSNKKIKKQLSNEDKLKKAIEDYVKYKDLTSKYSDRVRNNIAQLKAGNDPSAKTDVPVAKEHLNNLMKKFDAERDIKDLAKVLDKNTFEDIVNKSGMSLDEINKLQTEAYVNDGATDLMHYTDDLARAEQKNAIVEDKTNSELNQDLFDGKELREDVRQALLKIANEFKDNLKLPVEPDDIYFTGSEANYNYNDNSDIDVHLVYDYEQVGPMAEILGKYLQSAKRVFNDNHDITVKGLPVEVGAENKAEPLVTSGIYSLISNSWVKEPENANVEIEEPEQPYFDEVQMQIEDAISEKDKDKLEGIIKMVWDIRKEGLANEGEFGPSNTLFKKLRNSGILARLKDAYYAVESRDLSLESMLEAEFTNKDDVVVSEDDLMNKSEQEIADGLMTKYNTSTEAIAKLEDVLKSCDDGYKDKIKGAIQKIRESLTFGKNSRKLAEEVVSKLEEYARKTLPNMTPESYVDNMKDIANVDEMLKLCYEEIHPAFKYKRPKLAYTDENGKRVGIVLDGIEKGDDPQNVLYSKFAMTRDPKTGELYPQYTKNNLMPIEEFKAVIHAPENQKWYDWTMKGETDDWDYLIADIEKKARNINERYRKWCLENWERLDLFRYPPQYRVKLYNDIVHNGWPEQNAISKWQSVKKDRFADKIAMPKDMIGEAKTDNYYTINQNYGIVRKALINNHIPENIIGTTFAVEPDEWVNSKKQNDKNREPVHWFRVVGVDKDMTGVLVRGVTREGDDLSWTDKNGKVHARRPEQFMTFQDVLGYFAQSERKKGLNSPENFADRATDTAISGHKGYQRISQTGKQGAWLQLSNDEILAVLKAMEERDPNTYNGVSKVFMNSLRTNKKEPMVLQALKNFDPNVNSRNVSNVQGKAKYKIWIPELSLEAPRKGGSNPLADLTKYGS